MTHWPGVTGEMPSLFRAPVVPLDDQVVAFDSNNVEPVDLPDEWVLREALDADAADLVDFMGQWGPPAIQPRDHEPVQLPQDHVQGLGRLLRQSTEAWDEQPGSRMLGLPTHLEVAGVYLASLQVLARQWIARCRGEDVCSVWTDAGFGAPANEADAWLRWEAFVNTGMEPFRVHVQVDPEDRPMRDYAWGLPRPGWYAAGVLQLSGYIMETADLSRCANETCGRWFYKQRGRANYGQHRTAGVMYCTDTCARAQQSRNYRRRKKEQRP